KVEFLGLADGIISKSEILNINFIDAAKFYLTILGIPFNENIFNNLSVASEETISSLIIDIANQTSINDIKEIHENIKVIQQNVSEVLAYQPPKINQDLVIFEPKIKKITPTHFYDGSSNIWESLTTGHVERIKVNGNHFTMLRSASNLLLLEYLRTLK
ncbi:MAG: hypothetical protein ACHP9Y_06160, partial [Gammaproteobacteria bacterium]